MVQSFHQTSCEMAAPDSSCLAIFLVGIIWCANRANRVNSHRKVKVLVGNVIRQPPKSQKISCLYRCGPFDTPTAVFGAFWRYADSEQLCTCCFSHSDVFFVHYGCKYKSGLRTMALQNKLSVLSRVQLFGLLL